MSNTNYVRLALAVVAVLCAIGIWWINSSTATVTTATTISSTDTVYIKGKDSISYKTKYVYINHESTNLSSTVDTTAPDSSFSLAISAPGADSIMWSLDIRKDSIFIETFRVDTVKILDSVVTIVTIDRTADTGVGLSWGWAGAIAGAGLILGLVLGR